MGREEAESGVIFFQENQGFHALFAGYFKFVTVLRYIKEWTCCNKKGLLGLFGFFLAGCWRSLFVSKQQWVVSQLCEFTCMPVNF